MSQGEAFFSGCRSRLESAAAFFVHGPNSKDARFSVGIDWEIGIKPLALALEILILADDLFIQIPEQP